MAPVFVEQPNKSETTLPQRDPLTKALRNINCKESSEHLLTKFYGKGVVLYFIDVNGMGPTDKCGGEIRENVDIYITKLTEIAKNSFSNAEIVRYGGDEFGIIAEYQQHTTEQQAKNFADRMDLLRHKLFPASDTRIIEAQKFANHRALLRKKIDELVSKTDVEKFNITEQDSFQEIVRKLALEAESQIARWITNREDLAYQTIMTKQLDRFEIFSVMSLQITASYLFTIKDPELLSEQLHLAYATASREASRQKKNTNFQNRRQSYRVTDFAPIEQPVIDMPKVRSAELVEVENAKKLSARIIELKLSGRDARDVKRLELQDANLTTPIVRAEMLDGVPFNSLMLSIDTHTTYGAKISIDSFGLYNSVYGYERANLIFDRVAAKIHEKYPEALLVRQGGGDIGIVSLRPLNAGTLNNLAQKISEDFHYDLIGVSPSSIGNIRSYFELLLQAKIKGLYSGSDNQVEQFVPGHVKVSGPLLYPQATGTKEIKNFLQ